MAGLIGLCRRGPLTPRDRGWVQAQARDLNLTGRLHVHLWENTGIIVARVDHDPPADPVDHPRGGLTLLLDGEILEPEALGLAPGRYSERSAAARRCLDLWETGDAALRRLNGHFALVVHDSGSGQTTLVSDRCATRPIYYYRGAGLLVFASRVGLTLHPDVPRALDVEAMQQFFTFEAILDDRTLLQGIRLLPPASLLTFPSEGQPRRYWTMAYQEDDGRSLRRRAEELAGALDGAIQRHTWGIRDGGLLLSGGLDSRLILARSASPLTALTLADFDNREVALARAIAASCKARHVFLPRPPGFYGGLVDTGVRLGDGLYRFDHAHFAGIAAWLPVRVGTMLSGYGFDRLIKEGSLPTRLVRVLGWSVSRHRLAPIPGGGSRPLAAEDILALGGLGLGADAPVTRIFAGRHRRSLRPAILGLLERLLREAREAAPTPIQQYEYVTSHMGAPRILRAAFLNVLSLRPWFRDRTPAFDNAVLEQHLAIPPHLRLDGIAYRYALKLLAPQVFVIPDANTGLRPDASILREHLSHRIRVLAQRLGLRRAVPLPDPTFTQGSWPNMSETLRRPPLAQRLLDTIADPAAMPPDIFDTTALRALAQAHLERREDHPWLLLLVLTFGTWHRLTLSGEVSSPPGWSASGGRARGCKP